MNAYLVDRYGDPCHGCGYGWALPDDECTRIIVTSPERVATLLEGRTGSERHPSMAWNACAYVAHLGDNLRIWSERCVAALADPSFTVTPYDEEELARVRGYQQLSLPGATWSLRWAVADWQDVGAHAGVTGIVLAHPEQGPLPYADVRRVLAHESHHHLLDIERIVTSS